MVILVYLLLFAATSLFFYIIGSLVFTEKEVVGQRMESIKSMYSLSEEEDDMKKPFVERVINPAYQRLVTALGNITPASINKKYEKLIVQAGVGKSFTPNSLVSIQVMLALTIGGVFFLLFSFTGKEINRGLLILLSISGFFIPYALLHSAAEKRQKLVQRALPDLLDLLYISVEAGLGFDMALKKSAEKMPGPLSDEINKAIEDITKGRDRQDALRGIVKRTGVEDLNNFVTAVIQSELLGTNIAIMLKTQSTVMRQKRKQRAEETAMKIPIKMLFPLVFFLFPALFVVIMGPAVISVIENIGFLN